MTVRQTRNVTVTIFDEQGVAVENATVTARLSGIELYNDQYIDPIEYTQVTDASGVAVFALFPNALGSNNTSYRFKAVDSAGKKIFTRTVQIPDADVNLADVDGAVNTDYSSVATGFVDGIEAMPAMRFKSEIGTGWWRRAAGIMVASVLGSQAMMISANGINETAIGVTSPAAGHFTSLSASGDLLVEGSMLVSGNISSPTGGILANDGTVLAPGIAFGSQPSTGFYRPSFGTIGVALSGLAVAHFGFSTSAGSLALFNSTGSGTNLMSESSNVMCVRNGTSAQTFRVYNTFIDNSNYERLMLNWSGGAIQIMTEQLGTGVARPMRVGTTGAADLNIYTANTVRWFVPGSGGTVGAFLAASDNTFDIGANGATRPRTGYFGTSVITPVVDSGGTGTVDLKTNTGTLQFRVNHVSGAVNYIQAAGSGAGTSVQLSAQGSDASISFNVTTKGASGNFILTSNGSDSLRINADRGLGIVDGITAPTATVGWAKIFVDTADGDLKIIYGDGTVKTIVVDT